MKPIALYIHVPFCASKCAYCDFASWPHREDCWQRYFEALWEEAAGYADALAGCEAATVFFGGGTPSLVPEALITETLGRLRDCIPFAPGAEITLEANPGTLSAEKLGAYRRAGVNRLSLGAQSFDEELLRCLGRIHTPPRIAEAVAMARDAGFRNINLDLMYALPGQRMDQWLGTLQAAVALKVEHISAYSLIVEPGTPMAARVASSEVVLPSEDTVNGMQRRAVAILSEAGYDRYEISNFARPGYACRHNLTYWERGEYLGLGCAAHSLFQGRRFHNGETLDGYLAGERQLEVQPLTRRDAMEETLMLATRTVRGLDLEKWRADFGTPFVRGREAALERLAAAGLIVMEGGFVRLTLRGMELHNAIVLELMEEP